MKVGQICFCSKIFSISSSSVLFKKMYERQSLFFFINWLFDPPLPLSGKHPTHQTFDLVSIEGRSFSERSLRIQAVPNTPSFFSSQIRFTKKESVPDGHESSNQLQPHRRWDPDGPVPVDFWFPMLDSQTDYFPTASHEVTVVRPREFRRTFFPAEDPRRVCRRWEHRPHSMPFELTAPQAVLPVIGQKIAHWIPNGTTLPDGPTLLLNEESRCDQEVHKKFGKQWVGGLCLICKHSKPFSENPWCQVLIFHITPIRK